MKRAASLPLEDWPSKITRRSSNSDISEFGMARSDVFLHLSDSYSTDEEDGEDGGSDCGSGNETSQFPQAPLCTRCQRISLDAMIPIDAKGLYSDEGENVLGYLLHNDFNELVDCAFNGCRLCLIIFIETRQYLQHPDTETYQTLVAGLYDKNFLCIVPVYLRLSSRSAHTCGTFEVHLRSSSLDSTIIATLEIEVKEEDQG
jgi:hypothetical protein